MSQRELLVCASQSAVKSQPTPAHYERKSTALLVAYRQCCVLKSGIRPVRGLDRSDLARAAIALSAARPIVGGELLGVSLGETRNGTIHLSGCHADKVRRELGDVFASLTQWPAHRLCSRPRDRRRRAAIGHSDVDKVAIPDFHQILICNSVRVSPGRATEDWASHFGLR